MNKLAIVKSHTTNDYYVLETRDGEARNVYDLDRTGGPRKDADPCAADRLEARLDLGEVAHEGDETGFSELVGPFVDEISVARKTISVRYIGTALDIGYKLCPSEILTGREGLAREIACLDLQREIKACFDSEVVAYVSIVDGVVKPVVTG